MTAPEDTFAALHRAIGGRLFTVTVQDNAAGLVRRAYSSHPVDYPVSGTKPLQHDRWSRQVLGRGEVFVANTLAEFADVFFDHAQIAALGCRSALNLPVFDGAMVLGTVNVLDVEAYFTPARVAAITAAVALRQGEVVAAMRAVPLAG
ncbi:GAF domain-containing protein [Fertoebacter nigrum]|uniref:GAF domain-containing protein n=1 Tax=Fertoeibacter niger TaxID=2656921 RepID=A0A8X8GXX3_9RHOB|nr:GAF domain-containing protein [Fertoeibacter niger]NUB46344.1 GAF domain-containing protein [Fertoeibacter niger]